jgi:hypothetical protein
MNKQRFNVGDKVTYKSSNDCHHKDRSTGYYYGGDNQGGFVGTITEVNYYNESHDCYKIEVTSRHGWDFSMLEREFLEYDQEVTLKHQFKIGDVVCGHVNSSKVGTIIGFSKDGLRCMVEGWRGGHHGDNGSDYWYDHEGEPVEYYKGNDRYYLAINEIQKAPVTQVPAKQESLVGRTIRFNRTVSHCAEQGDCYVVLEDTEDAADALNLKGYGTFDRDRLVNGDCELMPKGWVEEKDLVLGFCEIGDIVVSLEAMHGERDDGDMFVVLEDSSKKCLYYKYNTNSTRPTTWRLATLDESQRFHEGVTNIYNSDISSKDSDLKYMIEMQEECKRRFPIGCKYIGVGNSHEVTLMQDDYTYRIHEQNIWAHSSEGCLFKNGQFATLVSLPATISASMSIGKDFIPRQEFYMSVDAISGKDFHISSSYVELYKSRGSLVHQKSIITKRNKKSIKLVIK